MLSTLSEGHTALAFTFDWVAQTLYAITHNSRDSTLDVWTVFDLDPVPTFLMRLSQAAPSDLQINTLIDPFRGCVCVGACSYEYYNNYISRYFT